MASLDFPKDRTTLTTPGTGPLQEGDYWMGSNNVPYSWDGDKWVTYVKPSDNQNHWSRTTRGVQNDLYGVVSPKVVNDVVECANLNIANFPTLPSANRSAFRNEIVGFVEGEVYRGFFHILEDGRMFTGQYGSVNTKQIYGTRHESLRVMPGFQEADLVGNPDVAVPRDIPGYVYYADNQTGGEGTPVTTAQPIPESDDIDVSVYDSTSNNTSSSSTSTSSSSSSTSSYTSGGGGY